MSTLKCSLYFGFHHCGYVSSTLLFESHFFFIDWLIMMIYVYVMSGVNTARIHYYYCLLY